MPTTPRRGVVQDGSNSMEKSAERTRAQDEDHHMEYDTNSTELDLQQALNGKSKLRRQLLNTEHHLQFLKKCAEQEKTPKGLQISKEIRLTESQYTQDTRATIQRMFAPRFFAMIIVSWVNLVPNERIIYKRKWTVWLQTSVYQAGLCKFID